VYIFDEPTSYLDIGERLNVAKLIRELAKKGKSVIVVEHDLIVLDYLSDFVHIAYGHKAAYGVISQPKGVRVGVNEYLKGALKSENIQIRPYEIKFEDKGDAAFRSSDLLCTYPIIKKKYPYFELEVDAGEIYNGEVIGILGPNATGKTTFVKVLAGVEKNDADGNPLDLGLSVSYKPQYITAVDKTVREVLSGVTKELYKSRYKREILEPLELEGMLDKNTTELSGGELQRVAIAECLSRDADIYLLDEPSAYLDIEQRLVVAKMLKRIMENNKKSAIVVDHDIAFADYISDKIMVFSGVPSVSGKAGKPLGMREGMNAFLRDMDITFRRDEDTKRPRANKKDSQKDRDQKRRGEYYYR